jgi:hypothetical protein
MFSIKTCEMELVLMNLHVLSQTEPRDKLCTTSTPFNLAPPSAARNMWRMWTGEGRSVNVERVREQVCKAISYLEGEDGSAVAAARVTSALIGAQRGLRTLMVTYADDASIVAQLNVICDDITDAVTKPISSECT